MKYRISGIIVLSSIGSGIIGAHYFNKLWPALPTSIAFGAVVLTFLSRRLGQSIAWLMGACGLLFGHTLIALLYPETLSVIDPDTYAVWVNQVINSGSISQAENRTYSSLPVFLLLISAVSEVTALAPRNAFVTIPILISVIVPLFTAWFTAILTGSKYSGWPAVPAALLSSVLTMTVVSGYRPIAMTVSYLLMFLAFIISVRFHLRQNKADLVVFVILGFAVTLSHRFTILLLTLVVAIQGALMTTLKPRRHFLNYITLPVIVGIFLVLQWVYLTTSISITVYQLTQIFAESGIGGSISESGMEGSVSEIRTSASKPVIETRILGIIARRAHALILIPIAGISWIYFARMEFSHPRRPVLLVLATAAVLGAFLPISIAFPDQLNYTRTVIIAEPVLLGLAVGCGWLLWERFNSHSEIVIKSCRVVLLLFGIVLIVAQVGSAPISTDHPTDYRGYLESDEATAKMWGHQYAGTNISADPFFAHEKPQPGRHVDPNGEIREEYRQRYRWMSDPYTGQSIVDECPETVMYRDIKIYRSDRAQILLWNPGPTLDTEYSRLYDAGKVQFYSGPQCR